MSNGSGRVKRLIAGGALGLSVLAFAPSPAGAAISTADFCAGVPEGESGFTDIALAGVHEDNVECLAESGITAGLSGGTTYGPQQNVVRGQMATFIANMIDKANELDVAGAPDLNDLPTAAASTDQFTDDEGNTHEDNINRLAEAGVVSGTTATTFSPNGNVSRAQMASFIAQAIEFLTGTPLAVGADVFTDDEGTHEDNINRLANADIVDGGPQGLPATQYGPSLLVSRAQMASFIIQALAYLESQGLITPLLGEPTNVDFPNDTDGGVQEIAVDETGESDPFIATFSGLGDVDSVDVSLVPLRDYDSDPYVLDDDGVFSFLDDDLDALADGVEVATTTHGIAHGNPDLFITTAGTAACGGVTFCDDAEPVGDELVVRIDAENDPSDSTFVVVFEDLDGDDELDLDANNQPTEPFGIAGPIFTNAGEAEFGEGFCADTYFVDKDANRVWGMDEGSEYVQYGRTGDTYTYDGQPINATQFETALSVVDSVCLGSGYNPEGPNAFDLSDNNASMPTGVTATVGDFDANATDTSSNDVRLSWTAPNPPDGLIDGYNVFRDGVFFDFTEDTTYVVVDEAAGAHQYRIQTVTEDGGTSSSTDPVSATVTAPPPGPVAGAPISENAVFQDPDSNGIISSGDSLIVTFNEPMDAPDAGDSITITDADGTVITITNGTNATFTLSGDGTTLTITLTGAPVTSVAGTTAGAAYGSSEVTSSSGVQDADEGLEWNLAGSTDTTF